MHTPISHNMNDDLATNTARPAVLSVNENFYAEPSRFFDSSSWQPNSYEAMNEDIFTLGKDLEPLSYNMSLSPASQSTVPSFLHTPGSPGVNTSVPVSSSFRPTAHPNLPPSDIIFISNDGVLFYVHSSTILAVAPSAFESVIGGKLDNEVFRNAPIAIPTHSEILNIILHALYDISPANKISKLEIMVRAVDEMPALSISPQTLLHPESRLYKMLLAVSPLYPMEIYTLAAHHRIHPLAVSTSAHLLSYPLDTVTDEQVQRMGALYLGRLVRLLLGRFAALKRLLLVAPVPHAPLKRCGFDEQKKITRAWALATAYFVWDSRLDLSTYGLQTSLGTLTEDVNCEKCKQLLQERIKDIILKWNAVDRTI